MIVIHFGVGVGHATLDGIGTGIETETETEIARENVPLTVTVIANACLWIARETVTLIDATGTAIWTAVIDLIAVMTWTAVWTARSETGRWICGSETDHRAGMKTGIPAFHPSRPVHSRCMVLLRCQTGSLTSRLPTTLENHLGESPGVTWNDWSPCPLGQILQKSSSRLLPNAPHPQLLLKCRLLAQ